MPWYHRHNLSYLAGSQCLAGPYAPYIYTPIAEPQRTLEPRSLCTVKPRSPCSPRQTACLQRGPGQAEAECDRPRVGPFSTRRSILIPLPHHPHPHPSFREQYGGAAGQILSPLPLSAAGVRTCRAKPSITTTPSLPPPPRSPSPPACAPLLQPHDSLNPVIRQRLRLKHEDGELPHAQSRPSVIPL